MKGNVYENSGGGGRGSGGGEGRAGEREGESHCDTIRQLTSHCCDISFNIYLTFKRRIKSHLPFAGIIRSSPYSLRFQDKG